MIARALPIRRVGIDGLVVEIGRYEPARRLLALDATGFPLAAPGEHRIPEGEDLPWVLAELAPSGYFAHWLSTFSDMPALDEWNAERVLNYLSTFSYNEPGNLVIGDRAYANYLALHAGAHQPWSTIDEVRLEYPRVGDGIPRAEGELLRGSSLGGDRPKFDVSLRDGRGFLVKFTPPLSTDAGRRWADLLRMEALVSGVLRDAGIAAASSTFIERDGRGFLEVPRFDRLAGGGRRGAVTLYHLGMSLFGEAGVAAVPKIARGLVGLGHILADEAALIERIHRFSSSIGNSDAHSGNYGLLIDDDGRATLAPFYDITPMSFAPRHDELPDARVAPFTSVAPENAALIDDLVERASADAGISRAFFEAWRSRLQR